MQKIFIMILTCVLCAGCQSLPTDLSNCPDISGRYRDNAISEPLSLSKLLFSKYMQTPGLGSYVLIAKEEPDGFRVSTDGSSDVLLKNVDFTCNNGNLSMLVPYKNRFSVGAVVEETSMFASFRKPEGDVLSAEIEIREHSRFLVFWKNKSRVGYYGWGMSR